MAHVPNHVPNRITYRVCRYCGGMRVNHVRPRLSYCRGTLQQPPYAKRELPLYRAFNALGGVRLKLTYASLAMALYRNAHME